jgi:hypothetical protein
MAAAGEIPGAAKFRGIWTFDIALLDAFISQKERETLQSSRRPSGAVADGKARPERGCKSVSPRPFDGHYAQVIQKLRQKLKQRRSADASFDD